MNFVSLEFLILFPLICIGYALLSEKRIWIWLLGASLLFYFLHSPQAAGILLTMIVVSYCVSLKIAAEPEERRKRLWLWAYVVFGLTVLIFFKSSGYPPVGISFYTFQTLSYVIDVYHRKIQPEKHLGYYALFVSFFPQLVAGPIERPEKLLPQLRTPAKINWENLLCGVERITVGFFKKLVVADCLGVFADRVYQAPGEANGIAVAVGTVFFAFQIYCDFSGYSDIACGAARIFGVRLTENFDMPYLAPSPRQFWKKWHISLTNWLTDYVYKPLGGNRKGLAVWCINIMVVFLCSGLWHGWGLHYVIWGVCHGIFLVAEVLLVNYSRVRKMNAASGGGRVMYGLKCAGTFFQVCFSWIFFRAECTADAFAMISNLFSGWSAEGFRQAGELLQMKWLDLFQILLGLLCMYNMDKKKDNLNLRRSALGLYFIFTAIFLAWLILLSSGAGNAFIYFQF